MPFSIEDWRDRTAVIQSPCKIWKDSKGNIRFCGIADFPDTEEYGFVLFEGDKQTSLVANLGEGQ